MTSARNLYTAAYRQLRRDEYFYVSAFTLNRMGAIPPREMAIIEDAYTSLKLTTEPRSDRYEHAWKAFRNRMSPALAVRVRSEVFKPLDYAA